VRHVGAEKGLVAELLGLVEGAAIAAEDCDVAVGAEDGRGPAQGIVARKVECLGEHDDPMPRQGGDDFLPELLKRRIEVAEIAAAMEDHDHVLGQAFDDRFAKGPPAVIADHVGAAIRQERTGARKDQHVADVEMVGNVEVEHARAAGDQRLGTTEVLEHLVHALID
jgi:hypothetical protein